MESSATGFLSPSDWAILHTHMRYASYRSGERIVVEGQHSHAIFVLHEGLVRVEQARYGAIGLVQLGPGELFGELDFLEGCGANASVIAETDVTVAVLEEAALHALLQDQPNFAARFYQALAIILARKLRHTTERLVQVSVREIAQLAPISPLSLRSDIDLPQELFDQVDAFEAALLKVERQLKFRFGPEDRVQAQVNTACDALVDALQHPPALTPLDLSIRETMPPVDAGQLAAAIGDYVFRETFPLLMLSTIISRCYRKPRGYPEDYDTVTHIYRNQATGVGILGPYLDRWFLARPLCTSRRRSCQRMTTLLQQLVQRAATPVRVTSLASGTAQELLEFYQHGENVPLHATCVDVHGEALRRTIEQATRLGCGQSMSFLQGNVVFVAAGQEQMTLPPQTMIYALGLAEYLTDTQVVSLLDWAFDRLIDDGTVILTQLDAANPDRVFMERILDWQVQHRSAAELRELLQRSRFASGQLDVQPEDTGVTLFAVGKKR